MTAARPYSLRIFLPSGDPDGLRIIEKSNWSGSGVSFPRALFPVVKQRDELARTGVYALLGPAEESGLPRVYIGEGDPIRPRLEQHFGKKDFWTSCIAFSSKDGNLNKAHIQHLESRLIELAARAKRAELDNGTAPVLPSLSEADAADAEGFLMEMLLCFPVLGLHVFSQVAVEPRGEIELRLKGRGVEAAAVETAQGFLVRAGSGASLGEADSFHAFISKIRRALVENGVLRLDGSCYIFTQDYVFSSPSTAGGVVLGRNSSGRTEWKTTDGRTLKALQEAEAVG